MGKEEKGGKVICFDLEGPISPQDNAYEVMGLVPKGHKIFEVISRYDDILALKKKEGYEPGDTLYLIVPFLLFHGISEEDIRRVSSSAPIVRGVKELMDILRKEKWQTYVISTSYEQHAYSVGARIGIPQENIYCTQFPLNEYRESLKSEDLKLIESTEDYIIKNLYAEDLASGEKDKKIKSCLDELYWNKFQETGLKEIFQRIQVRGGRRKVKALEMVARKSDTYLGDITVVADSITDFQMLKVVEAAGGLGVVFNGNEYALPYGTVGVATRDIKNIWNILEIWQVGGREKLKNFVLESEMNQGDDSDPCYHWLLERKQEMFLYILKTHKKFRKLVRGQATAKLG